MAQGTAGINSLTSNQTNTPRLMARSSTGNVAGAVPVIQRLVELGDEICKRQIRLEQSWADQWTVWDDIDDQVTSRRAKWEGGRKIGEFAASYAGANIYDATAQLMQQRFADGLQANTANALVQWFLARFRGMLANSQEARRWLEDVREAMSFELAASSFYEELNECYQDGTSHAVATMTGPEFDPGAGKLLFQTIHPREVFVGFDRKGQPNLWHHRPLYTGRQIIEHFGIDKLPDRVQKLIKDNPWIKHPIIHAIFQRTERDITSPLSVDKPWASIWVHQETKTVLLESGYDSNPMDTWIWRKAGSIFTCPAIDAIYDVMTTNAAAKSMLKAAQLAVTPALLLTGGMKGHVNNFPAGETVLETGQDVKTLQYPSNFQVGFQQINEMRGELSEKFQANLFTMLSDQPGQMTLLQASGVQGEKASLLIPMVSRASSMLLVPKLRKTFRELSKWGRIPSPPMSILQGAHSLVDLEMTGPIVVAAKRFLNSQGMNALMALLGEVRQVMPNVADAIVEGINPDELRKFLWSANSGPEKVLYTDKELAQIRQQKKQAMEQQQRMQTLQQVADTYQKGGKAPEPGSLSAVVTGKK